MDFSSILLFLVLIILIEVNYKINTSNTSKYVVLNIDIDNTVVIHLIDNGYINGNMEKRKFPPQ